mmetsp:Transcript_65446/g.147564  ORF Transcript_65446/g.147564 Transcript_65446/m.147564 type:complete len:88 (+) Transcript_65446:709-972(+)
MKSGSAALTVCVNAKFTCEMDTSASRHPTQCSIASGANFIQSSREHGGRRRPNAQASTQHAEHTPKFTALRSTGHWTSSRILFFITL